MEARFFEEIEGVCRLRVPFEGIYTSVFLVESNGKYILVDCPTNAKDVDEVIIPALTSYGVSVNEIVALVLTHRHGDHAGGMDALLRYVPSLTVIDKAHCALFEGVVTYPMAGHTVDSIGVLDTRTGTLISGDSLQGGGVDKYPCYTQDPVQYEKTLARVTEDESIKNLLFSHAYEPWYADRIFGRDGVTECMKKCLEYIK